MKNSMIILDYWATREGLDFKKVIDMHDESQAEIVEDQIIVYEGSSEEELKKYITDEHIFMPVSKLHDGTFRTGYSRYGELAVKSIRRAGTYLNLRCPLDAEYKIGRSWAETH